MNFKKIFLFILLSISLSSQISLALDQEIQDLVNEIEKAKEDFNTINTNQIEEAAKLDAAFNEIDKVTEFVKDALSNDNEKEAIKALNFIEKSLTGAASLVPQSFSSDMSKVDLKSFGDDNMSIVNEITANLNISKDQKNKELLSNLIDLNEAGLNTFEVVENLSEIGVNTVDIKIALDKQEEMSKWSKEEWANSWQGDILTDDGSQVISDDEINLKLSGLDAKLKQNASSILDKQISMTELNNKIDPLSNKIQQLKNQKSDLLTKLNEEILKQSSNILTRKQINESKKISKDLKKVMKNLTSEIKSIEKKSSSLNFELEGINLDLANAIAIKNDLENDISNLNKQLLSNRNTFSKKELKLENLKNTNLDLKLNDLNSQLQQASREKDFIEADFEKSIDLEVEALKRYHTALGNIDSKDFDKEIDFSMREIGVLMDPDPRKHRAFEIEKYATYAGFSKSYINESIQAVKDDDWNKQKEIFNQVARKLSKNPDWEVDIPTNAELNVMIEEEKAIQAAVLASLNVEEINKSWNEKIQEEVKEFQPLASLRVSTIQYAATWEGMREHEFITNEYNKILNESNLKEKIQDLEKASDDYQNYMNIDWMSADNLGKYDLTKALNLQKDYMKLSSEVSNIQINANTVARENLVKAVNEAKNRYNEIVSKKNPELEKVKQEVEGILKSVPTFKNNASSLAGYDAVSLRAKLVDLTNGKTNEYSALQAARDAVSKIGEKPVSESMSGPYWEMSNVKAAAIVRSKKYDWVDNYEYINAYYEDPLSLNSAQRKKIENELKNVLGSNNIKLDELNQKISNLKKNINLTNDQKVSLSSDIAKLENELSSLKASEQEMKDQLNKLSNQFQSKEKLIFEKETNIVKLKSELNPIKTQISELEEKRNQVNIELSDQLNSITEKTSSTEKTNKLRSELKKKVENQIDKIDIEISEYENQSSELNDKLASLKLEISKLKKDTPKISNQISKLNAELNNVIEIKADLAMAQAINSGIEINKKITSAVRKLENKSVVQLQGTELVKVVSNDLLGKDISNLGENSSEIDTKNLIVSEGVLSLEKTFSVNNVKKDIDIGSANIDKISISKSALSKMKGSSIESSLKGLQTAQANLKSSSLSSNLSSSISETKKTDVGAQSLSKSLDKVAAATKTASAQSSISTSNVGAGISAAKAKVSASAKSVAANEALAAAEAAAENSPSAEAQEAVEEAREASEAANTAAKAAAQAQQDTHQAISEAAVAAQAAAEEAQAAAAAAAEEAAKAAAEAAAQAAADAAKAAAAAAAEEAAKAAADAAQEAANAARSTAIDARIAELESAMEDWKSETKDMTEHMQNAQNEIDELKKEQSELD